VLDAVTLGVLAVACAALILRRTQPLPVWGISLIAGVAIILHGAQPPVAIALSLVTLYTIGTSQAQRTTLLTTAVSALVYGVTMTAVDGRFGDRTVTLLAFLCAAAAVGLAVRNQRAAVTAAEARAAQAESTREEEAVRRVTDERLRIARELHDVVAHHISVINVQAGVARHLMDSKPDQAREAMGLVRESSRTVLAEMSTARMSTPPRPLLVWIRSARWSTRCAGPDSTSPSTATASRTHCRNSPTSPPTGWSRSR
jgi:signal transduction histidine kinase